MVQDQNFDIVIAGAGIVGLSLARRLADTGLKLVLIDPVPPDKVIGPEESGMGTDFDSRVSALTVASTGLFDRLGVWEEIVSNRTCPYTDMRVWDAQGTGSIHFAAADIHQSCLGYIAENRVITRALGRQLQDQSGLVWLRPEKVIALEPLLNTSGKASAYRLQLESGKTLRASLLVGADGANSLVRRTAGFKVREWDYNHRAVVTTVKTSLSHEFTAWQRFMSSGPLAFLPLLNPASASADMQFYSSIVWSCVPERAGHLLSLDDAHFARELELAFESRLGEITCLGERLAFPLKQMHALNYVSDSVALVGDAAHTIHPLAGQGVNLGLLDIEELARVIEAALDRDENFACEQVLSRYQRRRKVGNLGMMAVMEGFKRLFESDDLMLRWLRNSGLGAVDKLPLLKQRIMSQAMGL